MNILRFGTTYINLKGVDYAQADERNERYDIEVEGQPQPIRIRMGSEEWTRLLEAFNTVAQYQPLSATVGSLAPVYQCR